LPCKFDGRATHPGKHTPENRRAGTVVWSKNCLGLAKNTQGQPHSLAWLTWALPAQLGQLEAHPWIK